MLNELAEESDGEVLPFPDNLVRKLARDLPHGVTVLPERPANES